MALTVVHSTKQFGVGVTSITTPAIATTSGNLAVVDVSYYQPANVFLSITDSVGLSWAESIAEIVQPAGVVLARQRYAQIATGNGSHTFTYNSSDLDYATMAVKEISGAATSSPLAETNTTTNIGQTSHTLSLTTAIQADCILCGLGACSLDHSAAFVQTGTFLEDQQDGLSADHMGLLSSHKIISAAGTNSFTFTTSGTEDMAIAIAAFKAVAAFDEKTLPGIRSQLYSGGMVGRLTV